jgi:hypothetical protein
MCVCVCVCVCVTAGGVRAQRGPGSLRCDVDQITAAVIWGSDAESVCGRVGLIVAPESGAYTSSLYRSAHIPERVGVLRLPWTPPHLKCFLAMKRGSLEVALLLMPKH